MATKSFLKDVVIKSKDEASLFLEALERAEKAVKKEVKFECPVQTIKDEETIRHIFS